MIARIPRNEYCLFYINACSVYCWSARSRSLMRSSIYLSMVTKSIIPAKIQQCRLLDEHTFEHSWSFCMALMFIGPYTIAIVDEWKTSLMSLAILFHLLCAQHVSDINITIFSCLRLCWYITTLVVLFSVRCVLELLLRLVFGGVRFAGWSFSLQNEHHQVTSSWSFIRQLLYGICRIYTFAH